MQLIILTIPLLTLTQISYYKYVMTDDDVDDGTEICLICEERGKDEVWYRCTNCGFWVHAECSDANSPIIIYVIFMLED